MNQIRKLLLKFQRQTRPLCYSIVHLRNGFLLRALAFRPRSIQYFQEFVGLGPHPRVNVHFRAFYMIVKVITKRVYQIDGVVSGYPVRVPGEQN